MLMIAPLYDVICSLLEKPFETWTEEQQAETIKFGRPRVPIFNQRGDDNWYKNPQFKKSWYNKYDWLCGSAYLQRLYCWPCLLFAKQEDRWTFEDVFNLTNSDIFDEHFRSTNHKLCDSKLKLTARKARLLQEVSTMNMDEMITMEEIRLNRKCGMFAIDAIMYLIRHEVPFSKINDAGDGSHSELVELLVSQSSDLTVKGHFRKIKGKPNSILSYLIYNKLVESISESIDESITAAIKNSQFFVLRIDDGHDESNECALFLRCFDLTGSLNEYFIGYYSLKDDKTSLSLFRIVDSLMDSYQYKSKLVGVSYDITCVKFNYLKDLRVGLKFMAQQAIHVNLLSHSLDYTIERCLCSIPQCTSFFMTLNSLLVVIQNLMKYPYFAGNAHFAEIANLKYRCCSKQKLLSAISEEWTLFNTTLEKVLENPSMSDEIICFVSSFLAKVKEFEFVFQVVFFNHMFSVTGALDQDLRNSSLDASVCHNAVKEACVTIYSQRDEVFYQSLLGTTTRIMQQYEKTKPAHDIFGSYEQQSKYQTFYFEMLDNIIMELHTRFENIEQNTFLKIGDSHTFEAEVKKSLVPKNMTAVDQGISLFPNFFPNKGLLLKELLNLRKDQSSWYVPLLKIIQELAAYNESFGEIQKFLCIIALLSPADKSFPCLHKFSDYLKSSDPNIRPQLAKVLMYLDNQHNLHTRESVKEDILNKLAQKYDGLKLIDTSIQTPLTVKEEPQEPQNFPVQDTSAEAHSTTGIFPDFVVEIDPGSIVSVVTDSAADEPRPGPSHQMEPDSSVSEEDINLAMTCEVYPAGEPDTSVRVKEEPPEKRLRSDISSATVEQELTKRAKEPTFDIPLYIKQEVVSDDEL